VESGRLRWADAHKRSEEEPLLLTCRDHSFRSRVDGARAQFVLASRAKPTASALAAASIGVGELGSIRRSYNDAVRPYVD
jgi:hypothetical protein